MKKIKTGSFEKCKKYGAEAASNNDSASDKHAIAA